jgi:hypothetical protein
VEVLTHADASFRKGGQINGKANRCLIPARKLLPLIRDAMETELTEKYGRFFLPTRVLPELQWISFGEDPKAPKIVPYRLSGKYMEETGKSSKGQGKRGKSPGDLGTGTAQGPGNLGKDQEKRQGRQGQAEGKAKGKAEGSGKEKDKGKAAEETLLHVLMVDLSANPLEEARRMVLEMVPPGKWQEFLEKLEETVVNAKMQHFREPGVADMMSRLPAGFCCSTPGGEFSWDDQPVGVWVKQLKLSELAPAYTAKATKPEGQPTSEAKRKRQAGS